MRIVGDLPAKFGISLDSIKARGMARRADKMRQSSGEIVLKGVDVMPWAFKDCRQSNVRSGISRRSSGPRASARRAPRPRRR
jgi:hypothetical protein